MSRCHKSPAFLDALPPSVKAGNPHVFKNFEKTETALCQIPVAPAKVVKRKAMNKTERDYLTNILSGRDARYEALTFRMANGHRYTPDFVVFLGGRPTQCHECKGKHALHSQQRARLAFDQARIEFPGLSWVWAVKTPEGWRVS